MCPAEVDCSNVTAIKRDRTASQESDSSHKRVKVEAPSTPAPVRWKENRELDLPYRRQQIAQIWSEMRTAREHCAPSDYDKLKDVARQVELALYNAAVTRVEYCDASTLPQRVRKVLSQSLSTNANSQKTVATNQNVTAKKEPPEKKQKVDEVVKAETAQEKSVKSSVISSAPKRTLKRMGSMDSSNGKVGSSLSGTSKVVLRRKKLVRLFHANACDKSECSWDKCAETKALFTHAVRCSADTCEYDSCVSTRGLLVHFRICSLKNCPVCVPVRTLDKKTLTNLDESMTKLNDSSTYQGLASNGYVQTSLANFTKMCSSKEGQKTGSAQKVVNLVGPKDEVKKDSRIDPNFVRSCISGTGPNLLGYFEKSAIQKHVSSLKVEKLQPIVFAVLRKMMEHKHNRNIFNFPVDPIAFNIPHYTDIIKNPMDLGTVRQKLEDGRYPEFENFDEDVRLVYKNSLTFNPPNHPINTLAQTFLKNYESDIVKLKQKLINNYKYHSKMFSAGTGSKYKCNLCLQDQCEICPLCQKGCIGYEPKVIYCSGTCNSRIQRNVYYYCTSNMNYCFCTDCYDKFKKRNIVEAQGGTKIKKTDLLKRKNNDVCSEPWVHCDGCENWCHQVCALYNPRKDDPNKFGKYLCPLCLLKEDDPSNSIQQLEVKPENNVEDKEEAVETHEIVQEETEVVPSEDNNSKTIVTTETEQNDPKVVVKKNAMPLRAKDLERTHLGDFVEAWVRDKYAKLQKHEKENPNKHGIIGDPGPAASSLHVRMLHNCEEVCKLRPFAKKALDSLPSKVRYTSKCLTLFQEVDDVDTLIFVMFVQEYGSNEWTSAATGKSAEAEQTADLTEEKKAGTSTKTANPKVSSSEFVPAADLRVNPQPTVDSAVGAVSTAASAVDPESLTDSAPNADSSATKSTASISNRSLDGESSLKDIHSNSSTEEKTSIEVSSDTNPVMDEKPKEQPAVETFLKKTIETEKPAETLPELSHPNRDKLYIAYLDSIHYFKPRRFRTQIYHTLLLAYLEYCRRIGYVNVYIWACPPPNKRDDYILHCHPEDQRVPNPERLRKWYKVMAEEGRKMGTVTSTSSLFEEHFDSIPEVETAKPDTKRRQSKKKAMEEIMAAQNNRRQSKKGKGKKGIDKAADEEEDDSSRERGAANFKNGMSEEAVKDLVEARNKNKLAIRQQIPYFDGDYWPQELEEIGKDEENKRNKKQKSLKKAKASNNSTVSPKKETGLVQMKTEVSQPDNEQLRNLLFTRLASQLNAMKQDFLVVKLACECTRCGRYVKGVRYECRHKGCLGLSTQDKKPEIEKEQLSSTSQTQRVQSPGKCPSTFVLCEECYMLELQKPLDSRHGSQEVSIKLEKSSDDKEETDKVIPKVNLEKTCGGDNDPILSPEESKQKLFPVDKQLCSTRVELAVTKDTHELVRIEDGVPIRTPVVDHHFKNMYMENRHSFLALCAGNRYQFNQLRRAKYSTMMVVYHLHNPKAPAHLFSCSNCQKDIIVKNRYNCTECNDFNLCEECYLRFGHDHQMSTFAVTRTLKQAETERAESRRAKKHTMMLYLRMFRHSIKCSEEDCSKCNPKVRHVIDHRATCTLNNDPNKCEMCKDFNLLQLMEACETSSKKRKSELKVRLKIPKHLLQRADSSATDQADGES